LALDICLIAGRTHEEKASLTSSLIKIIGELAGKATDNGAPANDLGFIQGVV
jgi:hypothetical protein